MSISILTDFLPIEVEIEGVRYPINWDFRTSILFEQLMLNNNISEKEKSDEALQLYYGYEIDTIKYINNNNNKLYIYIFNAWNKLNINNEKKLTDDNKSAIANALNEHNEEDIINAIENFGVVYKSDHYYNYAWILKSFLSRSNGVNRFMEDGDIWLDYKAKQKNVKRNSIFPEDFDIEKYID